MTHAGTSGIATQSPLRKHIGQTRSNHNISPNAQSAMNPMSETGTCICGQTATANRSALEEEHEMYTQQLKEQFEAELERQHVQRAHDLANNTVSTFKILQELVVLECDKILQFIFFKSSATMPMEQLDKRRNEINDLIKGILEGNSQLANGTQNKQLKASFDQCKKKLSEVLAALKTQLEGRYKQKLEQVMQSNNMQQNNSNENQSHSSREQATRASTSNLISQNDALPTKPVPTAAQAQTIQTDSAKVKAPHQTLPSPPKKTLARQSSRQDRLRMLQSKEF